MNRVTLIQCTDTKRDHPTPAWHLYEPSRYYRRMREWALARNQPWFILSAGHGLVHPTRVLRPYDERGLSEQQAREIAAELDNLGVRVVDVTAGRDYTRPLVPELESRGLDVIEHFSGERIGKREQLLKEAAERLRHGSI